MPLLQDTRNIGRVLAELGRRGMDLEVNSRLVLPRWPWMGPNGTVVGFD
jgi:3'-5' exoribonuclease 1